MSAKFDATLTELNVITISTRQIAAVEVCAMGSDLYMLGMFPQRLAQYLSYMGSSALESDILKVSFQFLSDSKDDELDELMGLVQKQNLKGTAVALRTGSA